MERNWNRFNRFVAKYWFVLIIILVPAVIFAETNVVEAVQEAVNANNMSLFKRVFVQGGFFMYLILILSIGMVYLCVDSFLQIKLSKMMPTEVIAKLKELVATKKLDDAVKYCEENECTLTNIFGAGLRSRSRGRTAMEEVIAEHGAREVSSYRAKVSYLNTVSTVAPMLGLLGTVSGMIKAFGTIGVSGMGAASELAGAISEALLTTAGGLIVAMPAMVVFFVLRDRVNSLMVNVEDQVGELIEQLDQE